MLQPAFLAPRPAVFRPPARIVIPAVGDELAEGGVGHRRGVDPEGVDLDGMRRAFVVVGPRLQVGAHDERAALDPYLGGHGLVAVGDRGVRSVDQRVLARASQLQRCRHGLVVLMLVLHDHPVDEALVEQRAVVELETVEDIKNALADVGHVGPRRLRTEQFQLGPIAARVAKGVVDTVEVGGYARVSDSTEQPLLLVVADVGEVPHQRRHQRGVLAEEVVFGYRAEQVEGPPPRGDEFGGDLLLHLDAAWNKRSSAGHLPRTT